MNKNIYIYIYMYPGFSGSSQSNNFRKKAKESEAGYSGWLESFGQFWL